MDTRLQRLIVWMEDNSHQRSSLAIMAQFTGLSSSRLRHKFKLEIGMTPTKYLRMLRLKKARELLEKDHISVKEARAAVGIQSDSYFTHQFERAYGTAPSRSKYS
jgi:transcriptional regulator GlxA family with amidase domain